jgi:hypothetical protein
MLINHPELYPGEYVTIKSFSEKEVVTHGMKPIDVIEEAKKLGCLEPVLIFVPKEGMLNFY